MKPKGSWRKALQRLLCGVTGLALVFTLLPVGALAAGEAADEPAAVAETTHHTESGFDRVLLPSTALNSDSGWSKTKGSANIAVSGGSLTFNNNGDNHIVWNEKIEADRFLISMDVVSPTIDESNTNPPDLKIEFFKAESGNKDKRIQVRFKFKTPIVKICTLEEDNTSETGSANGACKENNLLTSGTDGFAWTPNEAMAIDILVDKNAAQDKIIVFVNNARKCASGNADLEGFESGYFGISGQYGSQNFTVSNLSITTDEEETTGGEGGEAPTSKHITPLSIVLAEDDFSDPNHPNWTVSQGSPAKFDGEKVTVKGSGAANRLIWTGGEDGGKIDADSFLIQYDLTIHHDDDRSTDNGRIPNDNDNCALRTAFKAQGEGGGDRLQLEMNFANNNANISRVQGLKNFTGDNYTFETDGDSLTFVKEAEKTYAIDIKVDGNTVTVYIDGEVAMTETKEQIATMAAGGFLFESQFPRQNYSIDNFKITTDKKGSTVEPEEEEKPAENTHYLEAFGRVLAEDDFQSGDGNWKLAALGNSGSSVTIEDGKATIKGGGKNNRMDWALGPIDADRFLIQFDVTPNAGNTNSNIKLEFKCTELGGGEWLQLRMLPNTSQQQALIQRSDNHDTGSDQLATYANTGVNGFTALKIGETACFDVLVDGDTVTVYVNGNATPALTAKNAEIANMARGYIGFEGEYANQDFSISNFKVTTDEERTGSTINVTLRPALKGSPAENTEVGSLTSDIPLTGLYAGDIVSLTATPKHGYEFDSYTVLKADGSTTDGLVNVTNNKLTVTTGYGDLIVVAYFKVREPGRFELWYDDFDYEPLNDGTHNGDHNDNRYTLSGDVSIENGQLKVSGTAIPKLDYDQLAGKNYSMSFDLQKANDKAGTFQIAFKGQSGGATVNPRYALRLSSENLADFVYYSGSATRLGGTNAYVSFTQPALDSPIHVELTVIGNTVTFYSDGKQIHSYTATGDEAGWRDLANVPAIVNMTSGAPIYIDNLTVEILPDPINITVETTLNGAGNTDYKAGTVVPNVPTAVAGDKITLETVVKAGYKLEGFTVQEPYTGTIRIAQNEDGKWFFTVPDGASEEIVIVANFVPVTLPAARGYYIDSSAANGGSGTQASPWNSLVPLQTTVLNPGDTVYLKRGSVFNAQQLTFLGAGGTADKRITVTAYGEGNLPRLNGQGAVENVVELWNTPYVTIENLEITNTHPNYKADWSKANQNNNRKVALRAINIYAKNFGVVSGITIRNCYIHEVNGTLEGKWNGGIFFDIQASGVFDGEIHGIPTKYDSCLVENNTLINVDRSAIKLVSSNWCNQWEGNSSLPIHWYPSTNMVVRGNYMEKIGGDGITVRDVDGTLIEHNLCKDARYQNTGYNVGIWPFEASNTVIQYNEAYNTHGIQDGQGFDCDHASSYSLMQYNYSHNNEGGFMLIMSGYPHTGATVRYNISQNDYDKAFEFAQGLPKGTMIYNNTIYSDNTVPNGVLYLSNTGASGVQENGNNLCDIFLFNNLFYYPAGQTFYGGDATHQGYLKAHSKLYNNGYAGGITPPTEEKQAITAGVGESVLADPGKAPETHEGVIEARTGSSGLLDGYQLAAGSPMIDAGVTLEDALTYFNGGTAPTIQDNRNKGPREVYNDNKSNSDSLSVVMGNNFFEFPENVGVNYNVDFFGNGIVGAPDIGAAEYGGQHVHVLEAIEAVEPTCEEAGNIAYWHCGNCGKYFKDADATNQITLDETAIPANGHTLHKVDKVPATTTAAGVKEHWECGVCHKLFEDEAGTKETTLGDLTIPKDTSGGGNNPGGGSPGNNPGGNTGGNTGGATTETVTTPEGVKGTTTKDRDGSVSSVKVTIPTGVANAGGVVTAPVEVESKNSTAQAPKIDITVSGGSAKVEIPVSNVSHGTVAVAVDKDGNETVLRDCVVTEDGVILNVDGNVTVKIVENGRTFPDTADVPWAEDAIAFTTARELFQGTGTDFEPNRDTNRAMVVTLLYRLEYEPDIASAGFADVLGDQWYTDAVSWGQDSGVVQGYSSGAFGPEDSVTREQIALMLYRYAQLNGMDTNVRADLSDYVDSNQLSDWAKDAMQWAVATGLFAGHGNGVLDPSGNATRAQVAVLLMRFCERKALS